MHLLQLKHVPQGRDLGPDGLREVEACLWLLEVLELGFGVALLPPHSSPDSRSCCCSIYLSSLACFHPPVLSLLIIPLFIMILSLGNSLVVAPSPERE